MQSYKLKEWEQWESQAIIHPPHFCPNCGEGGLSAVAYWADSSRPCTPENPAKGMGYDCYCRRCHWSGGVEPDEDHNIVEEIMVSSKFVKLKLSRRKKK